MDPSWDCFRMERPIEMDDFGVPLIVGTNQVGAIFVKGKGCTVQDGTGISQHYAAKQNKKDIVRRIFCWEGYISDYMSEQYTCPQYVSNYPDRCKNFNIFRTFCQNISLVLCMSSLVQNVFVTVGIAVGPSLKSVL